VTGNLILLDAVRILETGIGPVIPVVDIIKNIGYNRSAITKTMNRHPKMFKGLTISQRIDTPTRGKQPFLCMNEKAIRNLILLMEPSSISKPELCERVDAFKAATFRKIGAIEEPVAIAPLAPQQDPLKDALIQNADIADIMIERFGYSPDIAHRIAMTNVINEVGEKAVPWKGPALLTGPEDEENKITQVAATCADCVGSIARPDPEYEKFFSYRKLADYMNLTEAEVKEIMKKEGLLSWSNGSYHPTMLATKDGRYGRAFVTYPEWPHRTYERKNIRWSPVALSMIRAHISGQSTLVPTIVGG
jgi:hypothetical protein